MTQRRILIRAAISAAILAAAVRAPAQTPPPTAAPRSLANHSVWLGTSHDGLTWNWEEKALRTSAADADVLALSQNTRAGSAGTLLAYMLVEHHGVGCALARSDKIWPITLLRRAPGGDWSKPALITIAGWENMREVAAPSIVELRDGRLRLYFVGTPPPRLMGDPPAQSAVYSAVSEDGVHFRAEPGVRFAWASASGPDIVPHGDGWMMYGSRNGETRAAFSPDGLYFHPAAEATTPGAEPSAVDVPELGRRLYTSRSGKIYSSVSQDGVVFQDERGARVELPAANGTLGEPSVIRREGGGYLMLVTVKQPEQPQPIRKPAGRRGGAECFSR